MTSEKTVYRCNICGNIIEVLHTGDGELVCCDIPMDLLTERIEGTGQEKHIPILEETEDGVKVKVGSMPHPMEDKHCIEWVEVIAGDEVYRKVLNPGDEPEAEFKLKLGDISQIEVREYCNIHGLWRGE